MHRAGYHGFTLPELLIVVAIIGVLLALLQPAFFRVGERVDHYRCTANLYYLSQAIALRRADAANGVKGDLRPRSWPAHLLPYLEGGAVSVTCPVQVASESEVSDGGGGDGSSPGGGDVPYIPPDDGSKSYAPLSELVELMLSGGRAYQPMDVGPWTLKLSDEQYQAGRSLGYLGADGARNLRAAMDTNYKPGANPYVYYYCFEDNITTGGDMDFNDTMIRVTDHGNGSYDLAISGHTAGGHALVSKADRVVLLPLPTGKYYTDVVLIVGEAGTSGGGGGTQPGDADPEANSSILMTVSTNYAMNGDYVSLTLRPGKFALMDYSGYLAHSTDVWADEYIDPNQDGVPIFARHSGMVNVLMTDGSVQLMSPEDLDPARPRAYSQYWMQ